MSEQNVELARRAVEAYNSHDIEAFLAFLDPGIEFHSAFAAVGGGVYHGHDGMRRFYEELVDAWGEDQLRLEPEAYFDLGEHTLSFYVAHGRGRESGADVALPAAMVARWRDGLCVYSKGYAHREDALRDPGVSKDALEPIAP
jgi:ketosteroid isomerase-like protein